MLFYVAFFLFLKTVEDKTVERQNMPRIKNVKKRFASINKRAQ